APTALASALRGVLSAPALGQVTASVVDVATGRTLYAQNAGQAQKPASTNKIATAVAALSLLGDDHRFTTRVVQPAPGRLVLVGGGDPTLSSAGLSRLAADTARALRAAGTTSVRLGYDISAFAAPALHPIGVNENIALVQALTVDEGRIDPHSTENAPRWPDPAARAAQVFAQQLRAQGVHVSGGSSVGQSGGSSGTTVAELASPPLADIVEEMLTESDNDVAEALGHQVARASGQAATFTGAAAAVQAQLTRLGVRLGSTRLADSSGLSGADALPAAVLTQLLTLAAGPAHPELRPVLTGLPVAGFTGTLGDRYSSDGASAGRGVVRAKTGSLSTVNTLAGVVVDRDGRVLAFAFMSNASSAATARPALDRAAAALAACGCGAG
ncbi:D-alanyl-D-alanine carboxypeptidase/D-alanyl-D-alanine-endopeptidase, partial [Streptacidiphilus monticola]